MTECCAFRKYSRGQEKLPCQPPIRIPTCACVYKEKEGATCISTLGMPMATDGSFPTQTVANLLAKALIA
jgi:hypothetical protein